MSYINYNLLFDSGLSPTDYHIMVAAKQAQIEDMSGVLTTLQDDASTRIENLHEKGYIKFIKGTKKDSDMQRIRIDKKGSDLLEDLCIPAVEESDIKLYDYIVSMYFSGDNEDRVIGNKKKVKIFITQMRHYLGMSLHQFFYFFELFISEWQWTIKLENLFMDANKVRYGSFINNIEDSPLLQWYQQNQQKVEKYWERKKV